MQSSRVGIGISVLSLGPDYRGYSPHWSWLLKCLSQVSIDGFPERITDLRIIFNCDGVELKVYRKSPRPFRGFVHKDGQLVLDVLITDPEYDVDEVLYRDLLSEKVMRAAEIAIDKCRDEMSAEDAGAFRLQVAQAITAYKSLELPLRFPGE